MQLGQPQPKFSSLSK